MFGASESGHTIEQHTGLIHALHPGLIAVTGVQKVRVDHRNVIDNNSHGKDKLVELKNGTPLDIPHQMNWQCIATQLEIPTITK